MLRRGLAFCTTLAMASVVQAGATITLVPQIPGPYSAGQSVRVDVMLANDGGDTDHALRFIQLDFGNSSPAMLDCTDPLTGCLSPTATHQLACPNGVPGTSAVRFWDFGETPLCIGDSASCGCGHFLEDAILGARTNVLSSTYYFTDAANLGENTTAQRVLKGDGTPLKIGDITVNLPPADGTYTLNVMGTATNPDIGGADVRWGFGTNINGEPLTTWRNGSGLSGGSLEICVGSCGPPGGADLVSSTPSCGTSLTRTQKNVMRLTFDDTIAAPGAGEVQIRELGAGGTFVGGDLSATFTMTVEPGNILRIADNGATLDDGKWYGITNNGWTNVSAFQVDYRTIRGDADNSGVTGFADLSLMNQGIVSPAADDDLNDIDGSGAVTFADLSIANQWISSAAGPKPDGHVCTIP
jgi:hypothetical protein